jgi:hypothetical protein
MSEADGPIRGLNLTTSESQSAGAQPTLEPDATLGSAVPASSMAAHGATETKSIGPYRLQLIS